MIEPDPDKPRPEARVIAEMVESQQSSQDRFLGGIAGFLSVPQHLPAARDQHPIMAVDQRRERELIPTPRGTHKLRITRDERHLR
jgi:hypothetical protein